MSTVAYRRRRQLQRQRRAAERRESWRRWKAAGGIMGWLEVMYPDPDPLERWLLR